MIQILTFSQVLKANVWWSKKHYPSTSFKNCIWNFLPSIDLLYCWLQTHGHRWISGKVEVSRGCRLFKICSSPFSRWEAWHEETFPICGAHQGNAKSSWIGIANLSYLDFEVNFIWPNIPIIQEAAPAHYAGKSLGDDICNARCYCVNSHTRELQIQVQIQSY